MTDGASFPAENVLAAGILKLSSSDALGPNPWTREKPTRDQFGLTDSDFDDARIERAREAARAQMIEYPWRYFSAFFVPLTFFAALFYALDGRIGAVDFENLTVTPLPQFEWVAYLGASLVLAAFFAILQTNVHVKASKSAAAIAKRIKKRTDFETAEREWYEDLKRRTTTTFWRDDIRNIANEKGSTPTAVFSQEVAKLFAAWGWEVKLNQRAQDYGVDMFANGKGGSAVVQCKHLDTSPASQDVRELAGSRHAFNADFGLLVSIHPPSATRQNGFFSDKGQLEFWHLGHLLEQCMVLFKQRTGEPAPEDATRAEFLNSDNTPIAWHVEEKEAAE